MSESIIIRRYQDNDLVACRDLWRELTEWHREIYEDSTIGGDQPELYFDKHLATVGTNCLWVAEHQSQVIGLVGLETRDEELFIEPLVVASDHRGKGVGSQLLEKAKLEAKQQGAKSLSVRPVTRNQRVIQFLFKQGFQTLGHIQLFIDFTQSEWKTGPKLYGCNFKF
ncbi:MAG: GNAT family N-acetyltransferase [Candidatus Hermodarchaeota archaeon]|nr:GNAT family N-acetyltransferase [Candidatus Hermodarchaeota archaeon]